MKNINVRKKIGKDIISIITNNVMRRRSMNLKLSAWFFLHDRKKFWSDFRKRLHILTLEKSQYYEEVGIMR